MPGKPDIQFHDFLANTLAYPDRFLLRGLAKYQHKFLAPIACGQIAGTVAVTLEDVCQLLQAGISGGMSHAVIQLLEMVGIYHHHTQAGLMADRPRPLVTDRLLQSATVSQPGEWIRQSQGRNAVFYLLVVGNVCQRNQKQPVSRQGGR